MTAIQTEGRCLALHASLRPQIVGWLAGCHSSHSVLILEGVIIVRVRIKKEETTSTAGCDTSMDRPFYSLTGHSTSRGIAAISTRPARNSTPSLADSMPCRCTGLIHYDRKTCRQKFGTSSLAAERAAFRHSNELSSIASRNPRH
jgi:hypothetical protein